MKYPWKDVVTDKYKPQGQSDLGRLWMTTASKRQRKVGRPRKRWVDQTHEEEISLQLIYCPFWGFMERRLTVCFRRFVKTCRSHLQRPSSLVSLDCFTLKDGTDRLSRNVGNKSTNLRCVKFQRREGLISTAAQAWNCWSASGGVNTQKAPDCYTGSAFRNLLLRKERLWIKRHSGERKTE
jgi:hypothetical protein